MKKQRKIEKDDRGVAIYARKSRITNKGDSIGVQFKQCADYAKKELGLDEEYEFLQYEDKGFSGYFSDRPDFQRMLHDVQDGKIKAIVCYKLDRVGRKTADLIRLMDFLEMYHVDLLICSNGINTASGLYKIFIQIFAVIAEFERDIQHLHGFCRYLPIPVSHVLPQGRNEDSFLDKYKSFVHRKKSYMDYRSDIRDGLTCLYDCISISFWDIQISWWEVCFASGIYCLPAHRKGWVVRTEGNTIFIDSIVNPFDGKRCFQRNKSFLESDFLKEGFVDFDGVKGCVSKKSLRFNKRMFPEKVN